MTSPKGYKPSSSSSKRKGIMIGVVGIVAAAAVIILIFIIISYDTNSSVVENDQLQQQQLGLKAECDYAYPDVCIPPPPPVLNCEDISDRRFTTLFPDPHGFDGDFDGLGCES